MNEKLGYRIEELPRGSYRGGNIAIVLQTLRVRDCDGWLIEGTDRDVAFFANLEGEPAVRNDDVLDCENIHSVYAVYSVVASTYTYNTASSWRKHHFDIIAKDCKGALAMCPNWGDVLESVAFLKEERNLFGDVPDQRWVSTERYGR